MSESMQDKTEKPTPKRREDAREKGQIPKSQEVTTALLLLAGGWIIQDGLAPVADAIGNLFGHLAYSGDAFPSDAWSAGIWLRSAALEVMKPLVLPMVSLMVVSAAAGAVQARGLVSFKPLEPQWSRISPVKNLKQIFSARSIANLLKSLLKLVIVATAVWLAVGGAWSELGALSQQTPWALLKGAHGHAVRIFWSAGIAYLLLAAADYAFQVWQHERQLKMTREEVKREQKETDGDAFVKQRMRSMGRAMARERMMTAVPDADVVIVNPTHVAVALKYDPAEAEAPVVLALGQRRIAQKIKEIAIDAGVPVVQNRPVARALLASCQVGMAIPQELYVAVAEILAYVFRRGGGPARPGRSAGPRRPERDGEDR
jgi:flagellar biosynthetic protein FlhB